MGFLMGVLGWPPQAAWAATPREVALAIAGRMGRDLAKPMAAAELTALMQAYPDQPVAHSGEEDSDGRRIP
jgi:uncharacterized phage protein (TIGR02216 family)